MIYAKCILKIRGVNDKICGYRLQDSTGNCTDVSPEQLKLAINSKKITVVNLTLTSDNRLVDAKAGSVAEIFTQADATNATPVAVDDVVNNICKGLGLMYYKNVLKPFGQLYIYDRDFRTTIDTNMHITICVSQLGAVQKFELKTSYMIFDYTVMDGNDPSGEKEIARLKETLAHCKTIMHGLALLPRTYQERPERLVKLTQIMHVYGKYLEVEQPSGEHMVYVDSSYLVFESYASKHGLMQYANNWLKEEIEKIRDTEDGKRIQKLLPAMQENCRVIAHNNAAITFEDVLAHHFMTGIKFELYNAESGISVYCFACDTQLKYK